MTYTPAETAERTGLSLDALRYYEREKLVGPVARTTSGHREYSDDDVAWIGIVTCLRNAGLGIADLRDFTQLLRTESPASGDGGRVTFLERRRDELEQRRAQLDAALTVLNDKIVYYRRHDA